ncbi:hypothetical protein SAMN05216522_10969 [Rosenbergiella nectarea]|uniref:Uncharacterized protein n=1 Tax=Rosenbergiella nectarea TaxID=988801 RepID=A0A1H9KDC4_9GAMM|nr:hypothetical protein [Rosenbergiella nectarea]SEQ96873.1 hypothetical protein SAMN05216522_10969 [Rosenbergiella nectarea]
MSQEIGERHAYQFAIHNPKAAKNRMPMLCSQSVTVMALTVTRSCISNGPIVNTLSVAKKVLFGETPTERKAYLTEQRSRWADLQNTYLEKCQHDDGVDARS